MADGPATRWAGEPGESIASYAVRLDVASESWHVAHGIGQDSGSRHATHHEKLGYTVRKRKGYMQNCTTLPRSTRVMGTLFRRRILECPRSPARQNKYGDSCSVLVQRAAEENIESEEFCNLARVSPDRPDPTYPTTPTQLRQELRRCWPGLRHVQCHA